MDTKKEMGKTMRQSAFAMVEAKYAAGDFVPTVFDAVQTVRAFWTENLLFVLFRLTVSFTACMKLLCMEFSGIAKSCAKVFS